MYRFIKASSMVMVAAMAVALASCSDDENDPISDEPTETPTPPSSAVEVNPKNVFTNGVPTVVGDLVITVNEKGQVAKVVDDDDTYTFEYVGAGSKGRAASVPSDYDAVMTRTREGSERWIKCYLTLNDKGFVKYVYEIDHRQENGPNSEWVDDVDEWWFTYNDDDQLATMKRTEGNNEVTTITYTDGDITKVHMKSDPDPENPGDRNEMTSVIKYTDATHSSPIENKSGIMLYDDTFRIDMDEMAPAYFAGLLGKGTKHLPLSAVEDNVYFYTYAWTLDSKGMPEKCVVTCESPYDNYTDEIPLTWK